MGASIAFQENVLPGIPPMTTGLGFVGEALPGMAEVGRYYGCDVKYQQADNYLHSHIKVMKLVLPLGNKFLSTVLKKRVGKYMRSNTQNGALAGELNERIAKHLESAGYLDMTKEQMAFKLNMSSRTLSRYLQREGQNWRELFTQLRMAKAKELLATSRDNLDLIAPKIGFSSASAFSNAFSREIGKSPQAYRQSSTWVDELDPQL